MDYVIKCILLFLILGIAILSYMYHKDLRNPSVLFSAFWFFILFMYTLRLYGLYETEVRPYLFIAIACFSFFVGNLGRRAIVIKQSNSNDSFFDDGIITILFIISVCFFLRKNLWSIWTILQGGSIYEIRYGTSLETTYLEDVGVKFLARPFSVVLASLGFAELITNQGKGKKHLLCAGILMMQSVMFDGALAMFEFLLSSIGITFIITLVKNKDNLKDIFNKSRSKKIRNALIMMGGLAVVFLFFAKGSLFETVYMHLAPAIIYLEERLKVIDTGRDMNSIMQYTYGIATVQGIIRPVMAVLEFLGVTSPAFDSATSFLLDNHDFVINVADGEYYNFFATAFAFYYKDFGVLGIIIFPLLYGILCNQIYIRLKRNVNIETVCFYIFFLAGIPLMIKVSYFAYTEIIVAFYWLLLCRRKRKKGVYKRR